MRRQGVADPNPTGAVAATVNLLFEYPQGAHPAVSVAQGPGTIETYRLYAPKPIFCSGVNSWQTVKPKKRIFTCHFSWTLAQFITFP